MRVKEFKCVTFGTYHRLADPPQRMTREEVLE
jgi:hypothetical protein